MTPHRRFVIRLVAITAAALIGFGCFAYAASANVIESPDQVQASWFDGEDPTPATGYNTAEGRYVYGHELRNPSWTRAVLEARAWYEARFPGRCDRGIVALVSDNLTDTDGKATGRGSMCNPDQAGVVWAELDLFKPGRETCQYQRRLAFHEVGHAYGFSHDFQPLEGFQDPLAAGVPWMAAVWTTPVPGGPCKATMPVATTSRVWHTRVQPARCQRPEWRERHRRTCRRGVLVTHSEQTDEA